MSHFTDESPREHANPDQEETKPAFKAKGTRTLRLLIASLQVENKWSNMQAVKDLINIGKPAVPALIMALEHKNPRVWRLASAALVKIGAEASEELVAALQHESQQVRLLAAAVLKKMNALQPGDPGYEAMWAEYKKLVSAQHGTQHGMLLRDKH